MPSRGTTSQFVTSTGTRDWWMPRRVQLALRKNKRKFQKLKGVFISHMHGGPRLGTAGFVEHHVVVGRREPLPVWGPDALGP